LSISNILSNLAEKDVVEFPFPHIVLEKVFSEELYKELDIHYPEKQILQQNVIPGSIIKANQRLQISSKDFRDKSLNLNETWKQVCEIHSSEQFYSDFLRLFSKYFSKFYGEENANKLLHYSSFGIRGQNEKDIMLDFQPGINTKPSKVFRKTVRGPHLDNPKEIFAALIYFRDQNDKSRGGDLEICKPSQDYDIYGKLEIPRSQTEVTKRLNYGQNRGIVFLNTAISAHSVTNRNYSNFNRRLLNIIGETNKPLFQVKRDSRLISKIKRKYYFLQSKIGINV